MRQGGANSFFRFVLGFTLFVALSMGITYAVTTIEIAQQKKEQTAAAFEVLLGADQGSDAWWELWK